MEYLTSLPWLDSAARKALETRIERAYELEESAEYALLRFESAYDHGAAGGVEYQVSLSLRQALKDLTNWLDMAEHQALDTMARSNREYSFETFNNMLTRKREDAIEERRASLRTV